MRYASIIRAELGWSVVLVDCDGNPRHHDVKKWGIQFEDGKLIPLDKYGECLYRDNFVMLINPNKQRPTTEEITSMALEKKKRIEALDAE